MHRHRRQTYPWRPQEKKETDRMYAVRGRISRLRKLRMTHMYNSVYIISVYIIFFFFFNLYMRALFEFIRIYSDRSREVRL